MTPIAEVAAGVAKWFAIAGACLAFLYAVIRWFRKGAVGEHKAEQSQRREEHHDRAEEELAKPLPKGWEALQARRRARRRRHE